MSRALFSRVESILRPYWVIAKVSGLVVASVVYLMVYEAIRSRTERLQPDVPLKLNAARR